MAEFCIKQSLPQFMPPNEPRGLINLFNKKIFKWILHFFIIVYDLLLSLKAISNTLHLDDVKYLYLRCCAFSILHIYVFSINSGRAINDLNQTTPHKIYTNSRHFVSQQ